MNLSDAPRYQCYAQIFWHGGQGFQQLAQTPCSFFSDFSISVSSVAPFRILPLEYPPLTLLLFSPPLLVPPAWYVVAFAGLMACAALGIYWLLLRHGPRGAGLVFAGYLALGAWGTAEGRFDLIPAGLTLLCVLAAERKRWALAYSALALGFLFKIYPILLLPALFLAEQLTLGRINRPSQSLPFLSWPGAIWRELCGFKNWRWGHAFLFFALIFGVSACFAIINFHGTVVSQLSYFANRPVEIEATGSTLLWLATLLGHPVNVVYTFGSANIVSDLGGVVSLAFDLLFVLGYACVILWQWRGRFGLTQTCIVLLLVFIATGKVFSPQYLIWLSPLLAYGGFYNRRWLLLWGSISLMTTIIYPFLFVKAPIMLVPNVPGFIEIVSARNLLLILLILAMLLDWWKLNQRVSPVSFFQ